MSESKASHSIAACRIMIAKYRIDASRSSGVRRSGFSLKPTIYNARTLAEPTPFRQAPPPLAVLSRVTVFVSVLLLL